MNSMSRPKKVKPLKFLNIWISVGWLPFDFHAPDAVEQFFENLTVEADQISQQADKKDLKAYNQQYGRKN